VTDASIFLFGAIATLVVAVAIGLLIWAAIEDGRMQREKQSQGDPSS